MTEVRHTEGPDAGAVWHYGDPLREQRKLAAGEAAVDLAHLPVFTVSGPDRLTWLHALSSQAFEGLAPGVGVSAFILDPQGHVEHTFTGVDDGETFWAFTEAGHLEALLTHLTRMVFASRVEVADVSDAWALIGGAGGVRRVPRGDLEGELGDTRAGMWASEALRIAAGRPRVFLDADAKAIPNELANPEGDLLGESVHLKKGCYRGQETVARVHTLGRPPRRLTLLHLDGSAERLPEVGADVMSGEKVVGRMGTSAIHYELGPIGLALLKRNTPVDAPLSVEGIAASQEVVVDPDAGLHVRPVLR
ncbi:MAG TPA: folate-binding protein [Propioniciclava sp.]|jgi:folate-binding protein YgfZ|uniref:CAF17-like 4Fe-4S cluster assembly/insertion protein YgfZ n=1 Tax=Propioniciclava sp. TaxID=2038686 RepID=UPI002C55ADA9|nr:folate-binding protein [Propioniciclava sp.]HRL48699.1 folate-binding protein [Propioniciclava sp.]HRL80418.1 folate-binding protein [Propioniciclava sp.]